MPFTRSLLLLVCCSLLAGAVLWVLVPGARPSPVRSGGYAALVTDAAVPDAELRELLASAQGDFAGPPVSESSQWALLDVFSGVERIPLDEYGSRVTPFDPRNDGYAEKLRSCFVRDGKRFVFIPRKPGASAGTLEKSLAAALGAIPFSVEYRSLGTPLGFYALLFAAASALLFLPRLGRYVRRGRGGGFDAGWALPCLPVLASLALCGAPGFALSALLLGLSAALEEPVFAWRAPRRIRGGVFEPFRRRWLAAPLFPAGLALVVLVSGISPLLALGAFAAYAGIFVCSIRTFSLPRSGGHVRFVPLPIIRHPRSSGFPAAGKAAPVMLPFALAAILAAFLSPFLSGVRAWGGNSVQGTGAFAAAGLVTEADYRAHAAFQASFSRRPLGEPSIPGEGRLYPAYTRDSGGLISPAVPPRQTAQETEFPPFPLQALVEFMGAAGANGGWTVPFGGFPAGDLAAALLPLLFIIPGLSIKRVKSRIPVSRRLRFLDARFCFWYGACTMIDHQPAGSARAAVSGRTGRRTLTGLTMTALFAALIAAGTFIAIPLPFSPVPIVLQNLFAVLAGLALGPALGAAAAGLYLAAGIIGAPVFAGASGGLVRLIGPTGGFLIGYLLAAFTAGLIAGFPRPGHKTALWRIIAAAFAAFLIVYAPGVAWLKISTGRTWAAAFTGGFIPFIPGDLAKGVVAVIIAPRLRRAAADLLSR